LVQVQAELGAAPEDVVGAARPLPVAQVGELSLEEPRRDLGTKPVGRPGAAHDGLEAGAVAAGPAGGDGGRQPGVTLADERGQLGEAETALPTRQQRIEIAT